jgi:hypothetical protein
MEIEACVARKPLIVVRTKSKPSYDPFNTVTSGAAKKIRNINNLESNIVDLLTCNSLAVKQDKLIKEIGLLTDGLAGKRIQDRLETL